MSAPFRLEMRPPSHPRAAVCLLLLVLILAACSPRAASPAPSPTAPLPIPPTLAPARPTSPPARPTPPPAAPTATTVAAAALPTPTAIAQPSAATLPNPYLLPGAYVTAGGGAALFSAPGAQQIGLAPAGARLGLLGRTADSAWLQGLYQSETDQAPHIVWVRAAAVTSFDEVTKLALVEGTAGAANANAPATPAPVPATTPPAGAAAGETTTVLVERLNLRSGPGTDRPVVAALTRGQEVQLLDRSSDGVWFQVQTPSGQQGWAAARYLQAGGAAAPLPPSSPAPSAPRLPAGGADGHIVFQTRSGGDIYIMNANGSGLRRLTNGFEPTLSPDGRQVAFTRWDEPRGLWLINTDGTGEHLLFGANRPRSATWSPDGSAIVFEEWTGSKQCRQSPFGCLTDDQLRQVIGGDCIESPFGRFCIGDFPLITRDFTTLVRYNLADNSVRNLATSDSAKAPTYYPAGGKVLFFDADALATTSDTGNEPPQPLVKAPGQLAAASYSPDGRFIYGSRKSGDHWDIWRWNADGGQPTALTAPPALRKAAVHSVAPAISPDGRTLLFLTDRRGRWEMWQMNADGSNQQPFAPAASSTSSGQALAGISLQYDFANERAIDWGL